MDVTRRLRQLAIALPLSFALGCQTTDPSIELLETELRWMEDQVYTMDRQLDQKCQQLASCQRNNDALRRELSILQRTGGSASPGASRQRNDRSRASDSGRGSSTNDRQPANSSPHGDVPSADDYDADSLKVPEIDFGPGADFDGVPSGPTGPAGEDLDDLRDDEASLRSNVTRIVLNSRLTGGYDFDGQPGDEGLMVVVEPQNRAGQYVALPGDLMIVVSDPTQAGPAARLAKWEFDASETVPHLKKSLLGRGIHLQLPWPNRPPDTAHLRVTVQYRNPAGRLLAAHRDFQVDLIANRAPAVDNTSRLPRDGHAEQLISDIPTKLSGLLSEQSMQPPSAPLGPQLHPSKPTGPITNSEIRTATRQPSTAARTGQNEAPPRWQPYR
ncbi:MAG: hypothetical protein KDA92_20730 [Planctomycetales bacterium]|nr:hypothetical protein [Planctomycetales bacterium]